MVAHKDRRSRDLRKRHVGYDCFMGAPQARRAPSERGKTVRLTSWPNGQRLPLMVWSGRAPAPPAIERKSGEPFRQWSGRDARHLSSFAMQEISIVYARA
jgi:hypothetical protein